MTGRLIHVHPQAPAKPAVGAACNGCGVCCLVEPCPVGILASRRRHGACKAVQWSDADQRYHCGLARHPRWGALVRRFIAAGQGCDCEYDASRLPPGRADG